MDQQDTAVAALPKPAGLPPWANATLALLFLAVSLALQLPGNVPYDGITVWYEAETGRLYAQHPAALVLVWRLGEMVLRGPAVFTALQLLALWAAAGILVARTRAPLWLAVCFYLVLLVYPPFFATSAVTVKDVFGAHLALLGFALGLPDREKPHSAATWCAAFASATLATLFRYQLGLMLPVLALLAWRETRRVPKPRLRVVIAAIAGVAATYGLTALATAALFVQSGNGDVRLSARKMMIFDIAGVVANNASAKLPVLARAGVDVPKLKNQMRQDYSPVRVDTLWQAKGASNSITATSGVFGTLYFVPDAVVLQQWLSSSHSDPIPLLMHRLQAFARVLGFGPIYDCRPILAGISWLPKPQAAYVMAHATRAPISAAVMQARFFPVGMLFRAWLYVLLCLTIIGVGLATGAVPPLLLSAFALAYEASFFFLPQACEVRYSYPVMLAAVFALVLLGQYRRV